MTTLTLARGGALTLALATIALTPAAAQKETPPPGSAPKPFTLPEGKRYELPNGMQVTLVPYGVQPMVAAQLVIRVGNVHEGPEEVWLADLAGDMLREGTATRDAAQLAAEVAAMGGQLGIGTGMDQTNIGADVLTEFGPRLVAVIADVARNPAFPATELPRLKANRLRQLAVAKTQPQQITLDEFRKAVYPDHPYGRIFPTEAMINGYTVDALKAFHARHYGAGRAHLYVAGRFDLAAMERAIADAFGGWARGTDASAPLPSPVAAKDVRVLDRKGAAQSTIYLGLPVPNPSSSDWVPLTVANTLLGGYFGSRITANIREDKGYTYSPFSTLSSRYRDTYWAQVADVTTSVTGASLKEIYHEIDRLRTEAPPADELQGVQNYLSGTFVLQNSNRFGIIGQSNFLDLHGLPRSYLSEYVQKVHAVTPAEVQRMARQYLDPMKMLLVVTGERSVIDEQLAPYRGATPD